MHRVNFSSPRSYSALGQYAHSVSLVAACVALAASTVNAQEPPASDSTTLQTIVVKSARATQEKDVYTASKSSVYISAEEVERFGQTSPGDVLKGQPGVQVGDNRNGGALDVNIRGIQGQNRVAVMVDGAQQSINAYRGYAGTQQRSYIDTDFIGGILIEKGPSLAANAAGSIGGRVQVNTIEVDDIVAEGRDYGIRLKGDLADNSVVPPPAGNNALRVTRRVTAWTISPSPEALPQAIKAMDSTSSWAMRDAFRATISPAAMAETDIGGLSVPGRKSTPSARSTRTAKRS